MNKNKKMGIALLGCGVVGGGTAKILTEDIEYIQRRSGLPLFLKYVAGRSFKHAESLGIPSNLYERDYDKILADPDVFLVAELIGGLTDAREMIIKAFKAGKHVVTANKALLAHHGPQLFALAREEGVSIAFEASCAGGIPIIKILTEGLCANRIQGFSGIVNGTCNHILTEMSGKGQSYKEALASAQKAGLAEADPTLDVTGMDSAHKLCIMASLAFGKQVALEQIPVRGIDTIDLYDVKAGREMGYTLKLLAAACAGEEGLELYTGPTFIKESHPLARISGAFNGISVYGHALGHSLYMGRGAGSSPTASAVSADIIGTALGINTQSFKHQRFWPDLTQPAVIVPPHRGRSSRYLRFMVKDEKDTDRRIVSILEKEGVGIASMLQKQKAPGETALIISTQNSENAALNRALESIKKDFPLKEEPQNIPFMEELPESIF